MEQPSRSQGRSERRDVTEAFASTSRWLYFSAELSRVERKFRLDGELIERRTILFGMATLDRDCISIATDATNNTRKLTCSIESASNEANRGPWAINIGYNPVNRELGLAEEWFVACYLPREIFDQLEHEFLNQSARYVSGSCTTDMWLSKLDADAALGQGIIWLLRPGQDGGHQMSQGMATMFRWSLAPHLAADPYLIGEGIA
jgi:hypothetical protein